jgi:hypothetical protein
MKKLILYILLLSLSGCRSENPFYGVAEEDKTAPYVWILSPAPSSTVSGVFTLEGSAKDEANRILKIEVSLDGGSTWRTAGGTTGWSYAVDSVGQWGIVAQPITIYVRATDDSPAKNQSTISVNYNLDNTALSGGGGNSFTNVGAIADNGGADDDRDAADGNRDLIFTWTDVTNSVGYLIYVFEAETAVYDVFSGDKGTWTITSGANTGITGVDLNVVSGTANFSFTGPSDGKKYYIQVKAYNVADNYSADWAVSSVITVDIGPPTAGTANDPGGYINSTTVPFSWSGFSDTGTGIAKYRIQCGDGTWGTITDISSLGYNNLDTNISVSGCGGTAFESGETVYLRVYAVDQVGNQSALAAGTETDGVIVDTQNPAIPSISIANDTNYRATLSWSEVSDSPWGVPTEVDYYEISVVSNDQAIIHAAVDSVTGDITSLVKVSDPGGIISSINTATPLASPNFSFQITVTYANSILVGGKQHYVKIRAVDRAGNAGAWSATDNAGIST